MEYNDFPKVGEDWEMKKILSVGIRVPYAHLSICDSGLDLSVSKLVDIRWIYTHINYNMLKCQISFNTYFTEKALQHKFENTGKI